jgi:glycine/D-amino acid oxidase-like deaminating enzyme
LNEYDYSIIGGGFYGLRLSLLLARLGFRVVIVEREPELCSRATYVNQARIHNGYHYPRSFSTALGSHLNYERFKQEMHDCVDDEFEHYYAIASQGSFTNTYQFECFCQQLGLPLKQAPNEIYRLFDRDRIDKVYAVKEGAFNAHAIRLKLARELEKNTRITCHTNTECRKIEVSSDSILIHTSRGRIKSKGNLLVTYAGINPLLANSGLDQLDLKAEITEVCLVNVPSSLRGRAVTVMDGPFFSVMPMPAEKAHSLTHVRYTPHVSWNVCESKKHPYEILVNYNKKNRFIYMKKDAQRYMPDLNNMTYIRSLFEVKTVPTKHEVDDGIPVLLHVHSKEPLCASILGSKIDSIFELEKEVELLVE